MTTTIDHPQHGTWWEEPLQTRNEHFASFDPADFPAISARQPEWRLSPIEALAPLASGNLDGGHYAATATDAVLEWIAKDSLDNPAAPEDLLGARAWAATTDALVVTVSGEGSAARLTRTIDGVRAGHLVIRFTANTHRTLIIENGGGGALAENVDIIVEDGANARIVHLGEWDGTALHAAAHTARIAKDGNLDHVLVSLSGAIQRVNPSFLLEGAGSSIDALGVYFADRGRHVEHRVFVHHIAPQTTSNVLYKGALHGESTHTVWVGDVLIGRDATGTDSYEANRNLVLSDGARADSIPNLEIETGDIQGAGHASATGRLDDEHLFYLQARGISESEARRLVALGFLLDIVGRVGDDALEEYLTERFTVALDSVEESK
ncbi:MAG: transporter rane component [Actinomycetota bacterium]|jgi:Fe-S cluster assembly protein SufD